MPKPHPQLHCLLSHKCDDRSHGIGQHLRAALRPFGIDLQMDPFDVGDEVDARMQTFDIEALILLSTPESVASEPVRLELESAERQGIPMFTIHLNGTLPSLLKKRSYWHMPSFDDPAFTVGLQDLVRSVQSRVAFNRKIRLLYPENSFHEMLEVARSIAMEAERTILAEFACELARRYVKVNEPNTRYWIALALGKANTAQAARLLDRLPKQDHPLALEGIRQARAMIQHDAPAAES
jgi:hypothetical protein